jgi:hypothetical protein
MPGLILAGGNFRRLLGIVSVSENLAFACAECNYYKGTDFATIDPTTGEIV